MSKPSTLQTVHKLKIPDKILVMLRTITSGHCSIIKSTVKIKKLSHDSHFNYPGQFYVILCSSEERLKNIT